MSRYVTIASGDNFTTQDINILDSYTAHLQSIGDWVAASGVNNVVARADASAVYGDNVATANISLAASLVIAATATGVNGFPVSPSTEHSAALSFRWPTANTETYKAYLAVQWYDSGGASLGTVNGSAVSPAADTWGIASNTLTSHASAAFARLRLSISTQGGGNTVIGDDCDWDAVVLRTGSAATFVPSLRIVAGDTYTKDPAGITAAFTSGASLKVGDGWAGDARTVTLQDGVGGPVVAKFDAQDVWTKYGYVGISNLDTWTDTTGRTWTLNGTGASLHSGNLNHRNIAGPGQILRTG